MGEALSASCVVDILFIFASSSNENLPLAAGDGASAGLGPLQSTTLYTAWKYMGTTGGMLLVKKILGPA
jgi:hypothetical protein